MANSKKGIRQVCKKLVFVNQVNIGCFWMLGPTRSLYFPKELKKRKNALVIFETEGVFQRSIR